MITELAYVTVIVRDQDEALNWYVSKFGFEKRLDIPMKGARWLTVGIPNQRSPEIILQAPSVEEHGKEGYQEKMSRIGKGTTWVVMVDDCRETISQMRKHGVDIIEEPQEMPWGVNALVADLYGNLWNLTQRK